MRYFLDNWHKFVFLLALVICYQLAVTYWTSSNQADKTNLAMKQLGPDGYSATQELDRRTTIDATAYTIGWLMIALVGYLTFMGDIRRALSPARCIAAGLILLSFSASGCRRPFEPVILEVINPNEEAFLLPYTGDPKEQKSSDNEAYLRENLIYTKQVRIPQQWVKKGYETFSNDGEWQPAAKLVKVDKAPVTREWTADINSGTSNKNEAIWVMTSDQVEFSTGWTVTARIASQGDAIKFLHNYPNGSLMNVLDTEVRSKLQASFGLEVTDLPMDALRKSATPHILKTVKEVTSFFLERGITITNLGITGGFVYKDRSILDTMVKVFNAEQERSIAAAATAAQDERNKKITLEADGAASALLKSKRAEAEGIKLVADAKFYELEKAAGNLAAYVSLKQLELQRDLLLKWDGSYPRYFMGASGSNPNMLLQLPALDPAVGKPGEKAAPK